MCAIIWQKMSNYLTTMIDSYKYINSRSSFMKYDFNVPYHLIWGKQKELSTKTTLHFFSFIFLFFFLLIGKLHVHPLNLITVAPFTSFLCWGEGDAS